VDQDGIWDRILARVVVEDDSVGSLEWMVSVDFSVVEQQDPISRWTGEGCRCG
jgi:hypothetical protein